MKSPWKIGWLTWVMHFTFAALLTEVFILFGEGPWRSASYQMWFYGVREVDQLAQKLYNKREVDWLDVAMDTISAVAGASLVAGVLN